MTQEALAERSGVSVSTIRGMETGRRRNPRRVVSR
ncbi:helix-turn-helix transcriptional regulator [Streptomyces sp. NBC_00344]